MALEKDLVWYLVQAVQDEEGIPAKTRLVKLVYLVDLNYMKQFRRPATNLRWIFHLYGPYTAELERAIDSQVGINIWRRDVETYFGSQIYTYRASSRPPDDLLPRNIQVIADRVVREWALRDLNELLSFVYFETPPMIEARRGEPLDLSKVLAADWPKRYAALPAPTPAPDLRRGLETWRKRIDEDLPITPLDPPARYDPEYERETQAFPGAEQGGTPLARGRLTIDPSVNMEAD